MQRCEPDRTGNHLKCANYETNEEQNISRLLAGTAFFVCVWRHDFCQITFQLSCQQTQRWKQQKHVIANNNFSRWTCHLSDNGFKGWACAICILNISFMFCFINVNSCLATGFFDLNCTGTVEITVFIYTLSFIMRLSEKIFNGITAELHITQKVTCTRRTLGWKQCNQSPLHVDP